MAEGDHGKGDAGHPDQNNAEHADMMEVEAEEPAPGGADGSGELSEFVMAHYNQQREEGRFEGNDDISAERTQNFMERALAESQRMSAEAAKSDQKRQDLYRRLGVPDMVDLTLEHASEVMVTIQNGDSPSR
ncbi:uncharacterized protein [Branchiostoma lanceolatum]|uniref:uncharacterized protein n=1 Tax=Branchiostoma lanceolatum TaxID=7740 RepID=UPI00345609E6